MLFTIVHYFIWFIGKASSNEYLQSRTLYAKNVTYKAISNFGDMNYTTWPLQEGYVGLQISNLNEYVQLFQECLVNVENYQGIDLIGITSPVFVTRYDVEIIRCPGFTIAREAAFYIGKRHARSEKDCRERWKVMPDYDYSLTMGRWSCFAHFELFPPELKDAPHFFLNRISKGNKHMFRPYSNGYLQTNLGKP